MKRVLTIVLFLLAGLLLCQPILGSKVFAQTETKQSNVDNKPEAPASKETNIDNNHETILSSTSVEHKPQTLALPREYSLNNGLKIILLEDKAYPLVSCFSWYKVGSRDDPAGMAGLTHLVEHLLFNNIGSFAGNQWANTVVRNGGEFSGFTSEDFTTFYSNVPTYQLELAIRGEAARMRNAHFTKVEVEKEIEHLVKGVQEEDLTQVLNREIHALAYERHPYHNPPGGWEHELDRLTYADAKAHYDRYFQPNNATLVIAGGFDTQVALNLIQKYFSVLPKAENLSASTYPQERTQLAEREIKLKARDGKETIILAYKVSKIGDADAPVISVLEKLLSERLEGQLRNKVSDLGLCSSVQVAFEQKRDPGLLVVNCDGIAANGSDRVKQVIDAQIAQIKDKLLSESEIKQAVKQTEFAYCLDGDGPYRSAFQIGFFATLAKGEDSYLWPNKIKQVTAPDVLRIARHYLNEENCVFGQIVVTSGNPSKSNGVKKAQIMPSKQQLFSHNHAKDILASTLNNNHFRLAAYQVGGQQPYVLAVTNAIPTQVPTQAIPKNNESSNVTIDHPASLQPKINYKVLRNGLRVFVLESHLKPLVQILGSIKAGAIYEPQDQRGISRLLTAILNSGNTTSTSQQLIARQNELGLPSEAMLRFVSGIENISFRTNCMSKNVSGQIEEIFKCLREPRLQNSDFEIAKSDATILLRQNEKKSETRIERVLLRSLISSNCTYYPIHPEEEISSIDNFKLSDLTDFYHAHVSALSTSIFVCGDVDTKEVFELCEHLSNDWFVETQTSSSISAVVPVIANSPIAGGKTLAKPMRLQGLAISNRNAVKSALILPQLNPAQIVLGRIIPVNNLTQTENYWAAMLVSDCALSSHPIFSRVSEQLDLNPQLFDQDGGQVWNSKIFKLADKLIWSMQINLEPDSKSSAAVLLIQNELAKFSKCGLRQQEVIEAKRYLVGNIPVKECSNLDGLTQFIFRGINELNEIEPITRVQRIINNLKYEDINEFIAKRFKPHVASIVVAGPKELIKEVHQLQSDQVDTNTD